MRLLIWTWAMAAGTLFTVYNFSEADPGKDKDKDKKPNLVQVDLNKLPPGVAKHVEKAAREDKAPPAADQKPKPLEQAKKDDKKGPPKKDGKSISLIEAISIAEKESGGTVIKAERKDHPEPHFKVDVLDGKGNKTKLHVSTAGKVSQEPTEDKPAPKPAKKSE
ncbi:MAG: PepSY domain-containing protein [Gemmataceae bacterium]